MKVINKNIEEIRPYANNPRFNDDAVEFVKNSIKNFGFKQPIVIDKNGEIIAGHTRYKASLELGLKEVPCVVADDLTDEQVKAYRLADNKVSEKAQWNYDLLDEELENIIDIDMSEFDFMPTEKMNIDEFFEDKETSTEQKKEETIICPYCNKEFIKE